MRGCGLGGFWAGYGWGAGGVYADQVRGERQGAEGGRGRRSSRRWRRGGCVVINEQRLPVRPRYLLDIIQRRVLIRRRFSRDGREESARAFSPRQKLRFLRPSCVHLAPRFISWVLGCGRLFRGGPFHIFNKGEKCKSCHSFCTPRILT